MSLIVSNKNRKVTFFGIQIAKSPCLPLGQPPENVVLRGRKIQIESTNPR
jgi:hypothetical protein